MMGRRVDVIIVNWNGRRHLEACLPSLAGGRFQDFRVTVADNGSTDGSQAWLQEAWPQVHLLELGRNLGFAEANNLAIEATDAPWVALLNNDTVADPGWLEALLAAAEADPRLAAVASRMSFMDQPRILNSTGIAVDPTGIAWDRLGGAPDAAGDAPARVFGASAGAALYRRAALAAVAEPGPDGRPKVFDPDFFMYLEDVDLAWRLRLAGWEAVYAPRARVLHHQSASSGEGSPFKNRLLARNKVWTLVKNYPFRPLLAWFPLVLAYDLGSAPYRLLVQGQDAAFRGRLEAWRRIGPMLVKRRRIQAMRRTSWAELRAVLSPFDPPWRVLARYRHLGGRAAPGPDLRPDLLPDRGDRGAAGSSDDA